MDTKTIVPEGWEAWAREWHYAPARIAGDLIYVSGCTAEQTDGAIPNDTEEQMRLAFKNVRRVLEAAGASLADVVEMTTYHVGLQGHVEEGRLGVLGIDGTAHQGRVPPRALSGVDCNRHYRIAHARRRCRDPCYRSTAWGRPIGLLLIPVRPGTGFEVRHSGISILHGYLRSAPELGAAAVAWRK